MITGANTTASTPPGVVQGVVRPGTGGSGAKLAYGFAGAVLGQSIDDWRVSGAGRVSALCGSGPSKLNPTLVCHDLPVPLGGVYMARNLTYTFVDGRLATIAFTSSIDGFAFVVARLRSRFGPPREIARDTIELSDHFPRAHVRMTWRAGHAAITLDDPTRDGASLSVRFSGDARSTQS